MQSRAALVRVHLTLFILLVTLVLPVQAQSVFDAIHNFPMETTRLEFSDLNKLRALRDYESVRKRYMGLRLQMLERILSRLGVKESDIDAMLLGWAPSKPVEGSGVGSDGDAVPKRLFGLARGRFAQDMVDKTAAAQKLQTSKLGDSKAYCFDQEGGICLALLDDWQGAFGTRESLSTMLELREFRGTPLSFNPQMMKKLSEIRDDAPIWGLSLNAGEWFQEFVPDAPGFDLDWPKRLKWVQAAIYSIDVGEDVRLQLQLDCKDADSAALLGRFFEGLRFFYQLLWRGDNSLWPKPLTDFQVATSGRRFELKLSSRHK